MTYSFSGIAPGSDEALPSAGHYKMLDIVQAFACGQLLQDSYSGAGNGKLASLAVMSPTAPEETWTLTCTAAAADGGTFSVVGSFSGAAADATVGTLYTDGTNVQFLIQDGTVDFAVSDVFTLSTSNGLRTLYRTAYVGTGNGLMTAMSLVSQVAETWTLTCTATSADGGTFSVTGSVSGAQAAATVGVPYASGGVRFLINDGTVDYVINDEFTLLSKHQELPVADRWTVLEYVDDTDIPELLLEGPGVVGVGKVYVGFTTVQQVAGDYYNLVLSGFESYIPGNPYDAQNKIQHRTLPMWKFDIPYDLRITARQIYIASHIESQYDMSGAGMYLSYYDPGQYPYPFFVMGSLTGKSVTRYSDTSRVWGLSQGEIELIWLDGTWISPEVQPYEGRLSVTPTVIIEATKSTEVTDYTGTGNGTLGEVARVQDAPNETWTITATSAANFTVSGTVSGAQTDATVGTFYDNGLLRFKIVAGGTVFVASDVFTVLTDSVYSLERVVLNGDAYGNLGELEGINFITGHSQAAENIVTDNEGNLHRVHRNINRTGFLDYCTLLLD